MCDFMNICSVIIELICFMKFEGGRRRGWGGDFYYIAFIIRASDTQAVVGIHFSHV